MLLTHAVVLPLALLEDGHAGRDTLGAGSYLELLDHCGGYEARARGRGVDRSPGIEGVTGLCFGVRVVCASPDGTSTLVDVRHLGREVRASMTKSIIENRSKSIRV